MTEPTRDWLLFGAAVILAVLGVASALEGSWPGFVAGIGTSLAALSFLARGARR